jgi:hypothetical protein
MLKDRGGPQLSLSENWLSIIHNQGLLIVSPWDKPIDLCPKLPLIIV